MTATYVGHGRVLVETAFGHLMLIDGADTSIAPHLIRDGLFDRDVTLALDALVQPGMVCLDVGANFGTYSLIAADNIGPEGRLVAVEPSERLSDLLFENLAMNGFAERCDVLRCAAGPEATTVTLHEFSKRRGGNTLLSHVAEIARTRFGETITTSEVPCRTIDEIVASLALDRVDLIKIDVEGYEREVLNGARTVFDSFRPRLFIEWHNAFFEGQPDTPRALYRLLYEHLNYTLHRVVADGALIETGFDDLLAREHSDIVATPE